MRIINEILLDPTRTISKWIMKVENGTRTDLHIVRTYVTGLKRNLCTDLHFLLVTIGQRGKVWERTVLIVESSCRPSCVWLVYFVEPEVGDPR